TTRAHGEEMADTYTVGQDLQGQILATVNKSQDMALEAIRTWTDAIQPVTSAIPSVSPPLAGKLPKPEEFVASAYNFAEQLLASQRKFAEDVLRAIAPLMAAPAKKVGSTQKSPPSSVAAPVCPAPPRHHVCLSPRATNSSRSSRRPAPPMHGIARRKALAPSSAAGAGWRTCPCASWPS